MRVKTTEKQQMALHAIRENVRMTAQELSDMLGTSKKAMHQRLSDMMLKRNGSVVQVTGHRAHATGGRDAPIFELADHLKHLSDVDFQRSIEHLRAERVAAQKPIEPAFRAHQGLRKDKIIKDAEKVALFRLNANFFSCVDIARAIGASPDTVREVAKELNIDITGEARHPTSEFIADSMRAIPAGTRISEWVGGTAFHMKSECPGIKTVTRHFTGA